MDTAGTESSVTRSTDGSGVNIGTVTVTRPDGTVVHRQEIVLADPDNNKFRVSVSGDGELSVKQELMDVSVQELKRIRVIGFLLLQQCLEEGTVITMKEVDHLTQQEP